MRSLPPFTTVIGMRLFSTVTRWSTAEDDNLVEIQLVEKFDCSIGEARSSIGAVGPPVLPSRAFRPQPSAATV
jgi:hypothetical protein